VRRGRHRLGTSPEPDRGPVPGRDEALSDLPGETFSAAHALHAASARRPASAGHGAPARHPAPAWHGATVRDGAPAWPAVSTGPGAPAWRATSAWRTAPAWPAVSTGHGAPAWRATSAWRTAPAWPAAPARHGALATELARRTAALIGQGSRQRAVPLLVRGLARSRGVISIGRRRGSLLDRG
jgi:hypothetical protein